MPHPTRPARVLKVGAIAAGLLLTAACGADTDDTAGADQATYCDIEREIDALFESAFSDLPDGAPEADTRAAMLDVSGQTLTFEDRARAAAPDEIADDVDTLFVSVHQAADGNLDAYGRPEVVDAMARVDDYCYGPSEENER